MSKLIDWIATFHGSIPVTKLFGWVAIFHGSVALTVVISAIVFRFRRGKTFNPQLCIAFVLFFSWIWSNIVYVRTLGFPTIDDLNFPILDVVCAGAILFIGLFTKELIFWMKLLWAIATFQLLFHVPYLVTYGSIVTHYQYHLVLNLLFDFSNLVVFSALFVPRRCWLRADNWLEHHTITMVYRPLHKILGRKKKRGRRYFRLDRKINVRV